MVGQSPLVLVVVVDVCQALPSNPVFLMMTASPMSPGPALYFVFQNALKRNK